MGEEHTCVACGHVHRANEVSWDDPGPLPEILTNRAMKRLVPGLRSLTQYEHGEFDRQLRKRFGFDRKKRSVSKFRLYAFAVRVV